MSECILIETYITGDDDLTCSQIVDAPCTTGGITDKYARMGSNIKLAITMHIRDMDEAVTTPHTDTRNVWLLPTPQLLEVSVCRLWLHPPHLGS